MRPIITTLVALLGLGLAAAQVADPEVMAPAELTTRWAKSQLIGHQHCTNCRGKPSFCDISTFTPDPAQMKAGGAAANVAHCEALVKEMDGWDDGQMLFMFPMDQVDGGKFNSVVSHGNCGLAFKVADKNMGTAGLGMGSQDAVDIVRDAIRWHGKKGKVFVTGTVKCNSHDADARTEDQRVTWKLYNPYP